MFFWIFGESNSYFPSFSRRWFGRFPWSFCQRFGPFLSFSLRLFQQLPWFFCPQFQARFNCLSCFFRSVLHLFHSPFLSKSNERRRRDQSNNQAHYFHDCLLFDLFSLYIENG